MATRRADLSIRPSVLDRLLGGGGSAGAGSDPTGTLAGMRNAVLRDLEWLLNTRRIHVDIGDGRPELERSVYRYGLADVSSLARGSKQSVQELARDLADSIRQFEPRLSQVRVRVRDSGEETLQSVHFVIEAMLDVDPEPLPVAFDTRFELGTGAFAVEDQHV